MEPRITSTVKEYLSVQTEAVQADQRQRVYNNLDIIHIICYLDRRRGLDNSLTLRFEGHFQLLIR